jgi:hypothetical protein
MCLPYWAKSSRAFPPKKFGIDAPLSGQARSIRGKDLPTCSSCNHLGSCTRCPGLAYMEGNMRGPSSANCEKSFVRTGIVSAAMLVRANAFLNLRPGPDSSFTPLAKAR